MNTQARVFQGSVQYQTPYIRANKVGEPPHQASNSKTTDTKITNLKGTK